MILLENQPKRRDTCFIYFGKDFDLMRFAIVPFSCNLNRNQHQLAEGKSITQVVKGSKSKHAILYFQGIIFALLG